MARPREKLDKRGEGAEVLRRVKSEKEGWKRERLLAVKHGLEGELNLEEIAQAVGRSRSQVQIWLDLFREKGVAGLLSRSRGKGPASWLRPEVARAFQAQVREGRWRRALDAQRWLEAEHGLKVRLATVYKYLGKCGARLKVPRPSHARKDPQAVETFQRELAARLHELELEPGRPVRLWVADEMRYGLQPVTRRVWTLRGERIVVPVEPRYQWGYVFGALQVAGGGCEFLYSPTVSLECSRLFLEQIARRDPGALHVVIWDGAGFHQKEASLEIPENVRLIALPPYSPELNPVEKLWDIAKDALCNRLFADLAELEGVLTSALSEYWQDARRVFDLIGRNWLLAQANASSGSIIPI